jgi:predicted NACHT family NTPase
LPDERVVLYQKCAETLLNTWHTWKFRTEDTRNRSRVEKQNQARMEYIAYSMFGALDTTDSSKRAIVAHDDLVTILSDYITVIERPRTGEARQLAEVFLKFVRERAGLLIEVGQGQYSFVHLTFQEYLAAVHLKNSGEVGGVEVIWNHFVKERVGNPRWHEVIRLLIGSLKQEESQRYFLEWIVHQNDDRDAGERAVLAGGCLLDSIAAAEEMADDILQGLLLAAARADSLEAARKSLHQLQALEERESGHKEWIATNISKLA